MHQLQGLIGNGAVGRLMTGGVRTGHGVTGDGGASLPRALRAGIEATSGISMDDVRVHADSPQPAALGAHAFASGRDIYLGPGQERHLPHEAWHVVQQKQGRVQPSAGTGQAQPAKVPVNTDASFESEADRMGAKVAGLAGSFTPAGGPGGPKVGGSSPDGVIQGKWFRMSTVLDEQDDQEVAFIDHMARSGELSQAFRFVVSRYPELRDAFHRLEEFSKRSQDVAEAMDNILWETFHDPLRAYTAAEVVDLLDENDVIVEAADLLIEEDEREIEGLVEQFAALRISVPFRSDVDGGKEEHRVYWGTTDQSPTADVIVASNPKPLKLLLKAKSWESFPLAAVSKQLEGLRKTAKLALYSISGNAKRSITGARTKAKMNTLRMALTSIANVLANLGGATHQASLLPPTNLKASVGYPSPSPPTEGKHVIANPLSINSTTSGSPPTDGRLMKAIRNLAGTNSKSYVQMHLLNDLVFGPGLLWNLTPGPKQSNVDMEQKVEDHLKRAVLGKGLVIRFEAEVDYSNDPTTASNTEIAQNPDKYRFQHIDFTAKQLEYDPTSHTWDEAAVQDADVAAIDGARINWRYGSLPPLRPKPRIFDPATTWKDLVDVGVQPSAAKRIVAFVAANPSWRPTGAKKQQKLADAVKKWDGGTRVPNVSSWSATAVLWT